MLQEEENIDDTANIKNKKLRIIANQISIIRDESNKFLISEFKIVVIFGLLLSLALLLVKGFNYKSFLIINFLYGLVISLFCAYISCSMGINECELVIMKSEYFKFIISTGFNNILKIIIDAGYKITIVIFTIIYVTMLLMIFLMKCNNNQLKIRFFLFG